MHLLVTRPEPEASAFAARLAGLGVGATLAPCLVVEPCAPRRLDVDRATVVIATSRNALTALATHPDFAALTSLALVVVGPGTAKAARSLGFGRIVEGPGSAAELAPVIARAADGPVLVLRGETVAFDLGGALAEQGIAAREIVVYRTQPAQALPGAARTALEGGVADGVVLMSPATAKVFTKIVQGADLTSALARLTYFCLSTAVAEVVAAPVAAEVLVARKPNLEEMLALIARRASQSPAKL